MGVFREVLESVMVCEDWGGVISEDGVVERVDNFLRGVDTIGFYVSGNYYVVEVRKKKVVGVVFNGDVQPDLVIRVSKSDALSLVNSYCVLSERQRFVFVRDNFCFVGSILEGVVVSRGVC